MGPDQVLLTLDIQFQDSMSSDDIEAAVDRLEKQIREKHPEVKQIFIEAETIPGGKTPPKAFSAEDSDSSAS